VSFEGPAAPGVFPSQWLRKAFEQRVICSPVYTPDESQIQPASVDLRLGDVAHRLRCSFLPNGEPVEAKLDRFSMGELNLRDGAVLEQNRPYLIPLAEEVHLPEGVRGRTNPKSSTGRLDIFTRVITDGAYGFDDLPPGYTGKLYLEVVSRSFTVRVQTRLSLNQLRLSVGESACTDTELLAEHERQPILFSAGAPARPPQLRARDGLFLSLAVAEDDAPDGIVGYRAKKNSQLVDLAKIGEHDPEEFWEPVRAERGGGLVLEPEAFYLLMSREQIRIPPTLAAEMTAYDPTSGELRTHYAGFFDPGFGYRPDDPSRGSRAALEVRAHDVPFKIDNRQYVCKLSFERVSETPDVLYGDLTSHYQFQEQTLSKHFRPVGAPGAPGAAGPDGAAGPAG